MTINLKVPQLEPDLKPRITVVGVGGAGGNAVNNMIENRLEGVEFVITNTDAQALAGSVVERKIQLGRNITQGLGAGSRPDVGKAAAEEAIDDIIEQIQQSNMVFITAGMGGGTGTGAAPVVARAAREQGILTVGVVTKPFQFEGLNRMRIAEDGIEELQHYVDTLIIIPNQNLFRVANENTTFADAFHMADNVLRSGVRGVTDLMVMPGLINLDFADVRQVMSEMGKAMMGTGEAEGEGRAVSAAESAISNPLLDDVSMQGAKGVLINITGSLDMTLFEVDEAANRIRSEVDPDANIIFGSTFDEELDGRMRISVIATGIDADTAARPAPRFISLVSDNTSAGKAASDTGQSAPAGDAPALDLDKHAEPEAISAQSSTAASTGEDAPFIPAPPVAAPEPDPTVQDRPLPDPLEAEAKNDAPGDSATTRRRILPSLFERVTGTGRARSNRDWHTAESDERRTEEREPRMVPPAPPMEAPAAPEFENPVERDTNVVAPPSPPAAAPESPPQAPRPEPRMSAPAPEPEPAPAPAPEPEPEPEPTVDAPAQQDLDGLESPNDHDKGIEDDLLEIPAFLRRQAN